ncbi:MAG: mevalonate kinase [Lactobacillus sp.]|nr:mevalonate kinase [Lactobacillus sp.]
MQVSNRAHGKVIIMGEHAVVYGANALAIPIKSLQIKTTVSTCSELIMKSKNYEGLVEEAPSEYAGLVDLIKKLTKGKTCRLVFEGEIPIARGLGSSATVALSTARALNDFWSLGLSESDILRLTNEAEMINHGKASGLDAAVVNSNAPIFFNKETGAHQFNASLKSHLLIMDTGQIGNTKEAVMLVKSELAGEKVKLMDELSTLPDLTKEAWINNEPEKVGQYFRKAQTILSSFKLSTKRIDKIVEISDQFAFGTKISGGGLGGIVIALCPSFEICEKIAKLCTDEIDQYWIEDLS